MERGSTAWTSLSAALLFAAAGFHLYRAVVLPLTTDEAFTFLYFASQPWLKLLRSYDANHHVLHSILAKLSVGCFGPQEWALRLPALAGGWLALWLTFRLGRRLCGAGPALMVCCAWMAGLTQVAEYFSLARGYSLGLAFFLAALDQALRNQPKLPRVSLLLGLAVAANLVFLIPGSVLALLLFRWQPDLPALAAPAFSVFFWFDAVPLHYASQENFYFGARTWWECIHSLLPQPALLSMAAILLPLAWWRSRRDPDKALLCNTFFGSLVVISILFVFLDTPLPFERTGIYLLALLSLLAGIACRPGRVELPLAALLVAVAGISWQVSPRLSVPWPYDSTQPEVLARIQASGVRHPKVAAGIPMLWALEYYRQSRRLPWPPVEKFVDDTQADFAVWTEAGEGRLPPGFQVIWQEDGTRVKLAQRKALPGH